MGDLHIDLKEECWSQECPCLPSYRCWSFLLWPTRNFQKLWFQTTLSKSMTTDAREGETPILYAQPIKFLWVSIQPTKPILQKYDWIKLKVLSSSALLSPLYFFTNLGWIRNIRQFGFNNIVYYTNVIIRFT